MKKLAGQTLSLVFIAIISVVAFAADKAVSKEVILAGPTMVGTKLLPAGSYKVTIGADSLSFVQTGVKKSKVAEATVAVKSEKIEKVSRTTVGLNNNNPKQAVLVSVAFRGQETQYVVAQ